MTERSPLAQHHNEVVGPVDHHRDFQRDDLTASVRTAKQKCPRVTAFTFASTGLDIIAPKARIKPAKGAGFSALLGGETYGLLGFSDQRRLKIALSFSDQRRLTIAGRR